MTEDLKPFLQAGPTVQSDDDAVVGFARRAMGTETRAVDQAVLLYYAVRDEVSLRRLRPRHLSRRALRPA